MAKPKKRTDCLAQEELIEARLTFVRGLVAEGIPNHTMTDMCREHQLFETGELVKAGLKKRKTYIARRTIKEHYIDKVRSLLREERYTAEDEIAKAYNTLTRVIEMAFLPDERDLRAVVAAQKAITKMLGLRLPDQVAKTATTESIREQMQAMADSVGLPSEATRTGQKSAKKTASKKKVKK